MLLKQAARFGLVALALTAIAAPAIAAAPLAGISMPVQTQASNAFQQVDWRPPYDRHHGHHRPPPPPRFHHPRSGIYFQFGGPVYPYYAPPPPRYYRPAYRPAPVLSRAHVAWCYNRYRSYRAYDNTFQPYHGPRQQCVSPYWR